MYTVKQQFLRFIDSAVVKTVAQFDPDREYTSEDAVSVIVYKDEFHIEVLKGGIYMLTLENMSWATPETSLQEMELQLFKFWKLCNGELDAQELTL